MVRLYSLVATLCITSCAAWVTQHANHRGGVVSARSTESRLFNVPPPSEQDVVAFKEFASKQPPPASFYELQQDCVRSTRLARNDGHKLLEVEFPPLPAAVLDMDDVSAYDIVEANLKLAIDFAKGLLASDQDENVPKKIAILVPDEAEKDFVVEKAGSENPHPGILLGSLRQSDPNDAASLKPEGWLLNLFGKGSGGAVRPYDDVDIYICLTASAQELPDIEELEEVEPEKTIICYNLKLDVLRGDLGAPAFPRKEFQDRFLSRVKPVYYLRTRQYSRSTPNPPFIVNYQGCLFRAYPGEYQTLLDTGTGNYRRLLGSAVRPALGTFKEQLTDALKQEGVIEKEGSTLNFLRTGYKTTTWWEEERENASDSWKT